MQLRLSIITATFLTSSLYAQDFVRVQYLQYNETDNRVDVQAPSLEINKDFGLDYTLNLKGVIDSVSGSTPIYTDTTSGATAFSRSENTNASNVKKQNVDFTESRSYGAISLVTRFDETRNELTTSYSRSYESDYASNNFGIDYLVWADASKNRSYSFGLTYQLNEILIKECTLNYECSDSTSSASEKMDSTLISGEVGISQIFSKDTLVKASIFYTKEDAYLSNSYYNVARDNFTKLIAEKRPDTRSSYGFNFKYFKSLNKDFDYNVKYKYYSDDWDIDSHTIDFNSYYELTKDFTIGLGLRYYTQSEAEFYQDTSFDNNEENASMDERLSSFNSITYRTSLDYKFNEDYEFNLGYNYYNLKKFYKL